MTMIDTDMEMQDLVEGGEQAGDMDGLPPNWTMHNLGRLYEMIDTSIRNTKEFRQKWVDMIEYSVGRHYNGGAKRSARPKNDIHQFKQAYVFRLAGEVPTFQVWAKNAKHKPQAYNMQFDVNQQIDNMDLEEFQERAIGEAFYGLSIAKVYTDFTDEQVEVDGQMFFRQKVCVSLVDTEDAIVDIAVKNTKDMKFIGNFWTESISKVLANNTYHPKAQEYVRKMGGSGRGDKPVSWEEQPLGVSGVTQSQLDYDLEDQVQLMDVYLPQLKWMMTLIVGAPNIPPLYGGKWYACDPYIPLIYEFVEGNALPMPPARHWLDVCSTVDLALTKLMNQLRRQKTIGIVRGGSEQDKKRLDATPDGGACRMDSQHGVQEARFGGPDTNAQGFTIQLRQLASDIAGNINALAGVDMNADTATEAKMMAAGSGNTIDAYRKKVSKWWQKIGQAIAWFSFNDALHNPSPNIMRGDPKLGVTIYGNGPGHEEEGWSYEDRAKFNFFDFAYDIVPNSNAPTTPEAKAGAINRLLSMVFQMFAPVMQEQGITIDMNEWLQINAQLMNIEPEVKRLMVRTDIPDVPLERMMPQSGGGGGGKPNGQYVHQSRPSQPSKQESESRMAMDMLNQASRQQSQQQPQAG